MKDCVAPDEIEPWQLDAYRDGMRDPLVVRHIHRCPACAQQVNTPDLLDRHLSAALFRFTCPTVDDLMNYQWDLLPDAQAAAIAEHLADCPHCAAEAAKLVPPASVETSPRATQTPSERLRVLIARLLPEGPTLAPAPVRASDSQKERAARGHTTAIQFYTIDDLNWDITLSWVAGPGAAFTLQGQLLGPAPDEMAGAQARLVETDIVAKLDKSGVFILSPVPPGEYALHLATSQVEIQVPNIKLA